MGNSPSAAPQSVDSAGLLLSTTATMSTNSPPSILRHPSSATMTATTTNPMMQTKTVELDPQPNNVNAELGCFVAPIPQ